MDDQARLTIVDVINFVMAIAFLGALSIPFYSSLDARAGLLSEGELLLYQSIPPLFVLVLFTIIWVKASSVGVR